MGAQPLRPFLIGIAGPSGSGKTALARRLAPRLPRDCAVISLDSYYLPHDHLPLEARAALNYDHPSAIDWDLLLEHLTRLRSGHAIEQPIYRFDRHTRDASTRLVPPRPFLVLEGILALYDPKIRDLLDLKIYVDTADRECLGRRLRRDIAERGRTESSVRDQYAATVRPMALEYVLPTRQYADVLVNGEQPIETSVERVLAALPSARA